MTNETLLLILLIILIIGALPTWPYSSSWGYIPIGGLTLVLAIFLIVAIADHRPFFRSTGDDIKSTVQDAGHDIKEMGRDAADSIRRTVE